MTRLNICLLFTMSFIPVYILIGCRSNPESKLNIAVAANMQYAIEDLVADFTGRTKIECNVILGSSGKLLAQITEGAPYDLFISADEKYPAELFTRGLTINIPAIYAFGQLVLICGDSTWKSVDQVNFTRIEKFALANAKTAPYGKAAEDAINYFRWNEQLQNKKVYGESISQTNLFIMTGSAEMGLTSQSLVFSDKLESNPNFILIPAESYSPLAQAAVILDSSQRKEDAAQFFNYLLSPEARAILKKFGYLVPES